MADKGFKKAKYKAENNFLPLYKTPDDLAHKIASEGFEYFFMNYESMEAFKSIPDLYEAVKAYSEARTELDKVLERHNVFWEDMDC